VGWIESVWQKLEWALPLAPIHVQPNEVDQDHIVGFYCQLAQVCVFLKVDRGGSWRDRVQTQSLLDYVAQIGQIRAALQVEAASESVFD